MDTSIHQTGAEIPAAHVIEEIELHLSPEPTFTNKGFGKRVVKAGGRFSHARGNREKRFVHVPINEVKLIEDLLELFPTYKKTTVVFRGPNSYRLPSWVCVQYVPNDTKNALQFALNARKKHLEFAKKKGWA
jgi:hypothetical protein